MADTSPCILNLAEVAHGALVTKQLAWPRAGKNRCRQRLNPLWHHSITVSALLCRTKNICGGSLERRPSACSKSDRADTQRVNMTGAKEDVPAKLFIGQELDGRVGNDAHTISPVALHHSSNTFCFGHVFEALR